MIKIKQWTAVWMAAFWLMAASGAFADEVRDSSQKPFAEEDIEQLVAPVALYPDALLSQVLMASTYPLEIVRAARWQQQHPDLKDDALDEALAAEDWDPSVKSLTHFPDVLKRMSENLDWTQDLGDAVLAQQDDVMDTVQRMRRYAYEYGNLKESSEQKVVVEEKIIRIEPATEVIYVPAYNPTVIYGSAWAPPRYYYPVYSYPPSYWYPPGYVASNLISFGLGVVIGKAIWGDYDWHHRHFYYRDRHPHWKGDVNINVNIDRSRNYYKWEHNPKHREGVRYRDRSTREKYDRIRDQGGRQPRIDRDSARGFDRVATRDIKRPDTRDIKRPETRDVKRPETRDVKRPETRDVKRPETRDIQRPETREVKRPETREIKRDQPRVSTRDTSPTTTKQNAFKMDRGSLDRAASKRGASSRGNISRSGGGNR